MKQKEAKPSMSKVMDRIFPLLKMPNIAGGGI